MIPLTEKRGAPEYAPLQAHSYYSFKEGVSSPAEYFAAARGLNLPAVAIADWTNFHALGPAYRASRDTGVRYIPGVRLPVYLEGLNNPEPVIFLALDNQGLGLLFHWVTRTSHRQALTHEDIGFYRGGGIAFIVSGEFGNNKRDLLELPGVYYGLDHVQPAERETIRRLERQTGKTVVADAVKMATPGQLPLLKILKKMFPKENGGWSLHGQANEYAFKKPLDLLAAYAGFGFALARTLEIAQDSKVNLPQVPVMRPKTLPEGMTAARFLRSQLRGQLSALPGGNELLQRLDGELDIAEQMHFNEYFMVLGEIFDYLKSRDIPYRITGSARNSLTVQLLDKRPIDAAGLDYLRFMNPYRIDFPDVDLDFPYDRIDEVEKFLRENYGMSHFSLVKKLQRGGWKNLTAQAEKKQGIKLSGEERELLYGSDLPLGTVARHPSGMAFFPNAPQSVIAGREVAQLEKQFLESDVRVPILDILSKVGLARIAKIQKMREQPENGTDIPPADEATFHRLFGRAATIGVSLVESAHMRNLLLAAGRSKSEFTIDDISHILALARPAGRNNRNQYFRNLHNAGLPPEMPQIAEYPELKDIIGRSNYCVIYQEQARRLASEAAGLKFSAADRLRKLLAQADINKDALPPELAAHLEELRQGLTKKYPKRIVEYIFDQVNGFRGYGFVEGHSRELAETVYQLAYLYEHHPREYWTAVMQTMAEKKSLILDYYPQTYMNQAIRDGIIFEFPDIDRLPPVPYLENGRIIAGRQLLGEKPDSGRPARRKFNAVYDEFMKILNGWETAVSDKAQFQLDNFGLCLTEDLSGRIPPEFRYPPIGMPPLIMGMRATPVSVQDGRALVTVESGGHLVNLVIPENVYAKRKSLLKRDFIKAHIASENRGLTWSVVEVFDE